MSRIIKEPFEPRRRHLVFGNGAASSGDWWSSLQGMLVGVPKLRNAAHEDICMVVLLVCLLITTLLLPWIIL